MADSEVAPTAKCSTTTTRSSLLDSEVAAVKRVFKPLNRFASLRSHIALSAVGLLTATGCGSGSGPEIGTVSGKVTLDGKAVTDAVVTFNPDKGRGSRGRTNSDGVYELTYVGQQKGALVGEHAITITTKWMDEDPDTGKMVQHAETVPAKFNAQSTLRKSVESGHNTIDFDLASK